MGDPGDRSVADQSAHDRTAERVWLQFVVQIKSDNPTVRPHERPDRSGDLVEQSKVGEFEVDDAEIELWQLLQGLSCIALHDLAQCYSRMQAGQRID